MVRTRILATLCLLSLVACGNEASTVTVSSRPSEGPRPPDVGEPPITSPGGNMPRPSDPVAEMLAQYNKFFVTQWGPTAFNSTPGAPDGYDDCGPASLVMVGASRGLFTPPTPNEAEGAIRTMRDRSHGGPTPVSSPTYGPMMLTGLLASGFAAFDLRLDLAPENLDSDVVLITEALFNERTVLIAGDPGHAWGRALDAKKQYLHPYDVAPDKDAFGHWVVAFAIRSNGDVILADPLSKAGNVTVTSTQIRTYLADGGALSGAIVVEKTTPSP